MKRFQNILVGIDLSWADSFVAEELSASRVEDVRQELWLAKQLRPWTSCPLLDLSVKA